MKALFYALLIKGLWYLVCEWEAPSKDDRRTRKFGLQKPTRNYDQCLKIQQIRPVPEAGMPKMSTERRYHTCPIHLRWSKCSANSLSELLSKPRVSFVSLQTRNTESRNRMVFREPRRFCLPGRRIGLAAILIYKIFTILFKILFTFF